MRFAVSLRRSADPDGGQEWQAKHFSTVGFVAGASRGTQASAIQETIELGPPGLPNDKLQTRGP